MPANTRRTGLVSFLATAAVALVLAYIASVDASAPFDRLLGNLAPLPVLLGFALLGGLALFRLIALGWASGTALPPLPVIPVLAGLAMILALPTIAVDVIAPWPKDINAAFPVALAYYPAMALIAETLFHLVPLVLLSFLLPGRGFWSAALIAALIEPAFQLAAEAGTGAPGWRQAYMALHLTAFNLVQIALLRRYGFIASYGFRLSYYLVWHILWGVTRLGLLFPA